MGDREDLLERIRQHELGRSATIETPFGRRLLCYADQTASGRFVGFVETWMGRLRPYYANSHTVISSTGTLMTGLREQARSIVARSVGASADDVVLFVGSGATACVNKLVGLFGLDVPPPEFSGFSAASLPPAQRPLVLVGPYEHHSNELPWIESVAEVLEIGETDDGGIDLAHLERALVQARAEARPLVIGSFSAASNVTGVITDVAAVARLLHGHGALACFDYAASAPYVPIDMHPAGDPDARLDAIFISTHKFVGGPQGSGVLVAGRHCFRRPVPERPGGGTVDYVSYFGRLHVDYSRRLDEREEGGTPAIIGDIRAGAAFLLRELMDPRTLIDHEIGLARRAVERLAQNRRIRILGPLGRPRLPILSFAIDGLHHDFVSTLLDHLFGIQNRAGCACAGPYGHRLLGVSEARSQAFRRWILRGVLGIKPGWTRVTLPAYASEADIEFILSAVEFVADHGDAFLPMYELGWRDGVWTARGFAPSPPPFEITLENLISGAPRAAADSGISDAELAAERARYFDEARRVAARLREHHLGELARPAPPTGHPDLDELIWFRCLHAGRVPSESEWSTLPPPVASD
jgi:selenocysteine lyase/cysteine desulfurase